MTDLSKVKLALESAIELMKRMDTLRHLDPDFLHLRLCEEALSHISSLSEAVPVAEVAEEVFERCQIGASISDIVDVLAKWRDSQLYAHPLPQQEKDAEMDSKRLDFLTSFESTWHVQWEKRPGKDVRYRMIDDGEAWGKWHPTARAAIDAAMQQETQNG